jgi:hyperosmotically inducible protein
MNRLRRLLLILGSLALCVPLTAGLVARYQAVPDSTKRNRDLSESTADQQKMNPADRALTQQIRKAIHRDKRLSSCARNIKISTQNGKVILRGPVRSEEEKGNLQAKAVILVGEENVTNQLEVAPSTAQSRNRN